MECCTGAPSWHSPARRSTVRRDGPGVASWRDKVAPPMSSQPLDLDVFTDRQWQMHFGERFALEGLLRSLKPALSIEIGRAQGGSLRRLARHSEQVHSFDLIDGPAELRIELANVQFHT